MNKEQQELLDEVYENYKSTILEKEIKKSAFELTVQSMSGKIFIVPKEEFINKCKTDAEFSEKWGLKIEERDLTPKERIELAGGRIQDKYPSLVEMSTLVCDERDIPTKLITVTHNDKTIESHE
jgi:hypothetical protein